MLVIGFVVLSLTVQSSVALLRLKDISAEGLHARKVVRVAGSIGIINHELLKQDFRFQQQWDNKRIEEWFLDTGSSVPWQSDGFHRCQGFWHGFLFEEGRTRQRGDGRHGNLP